MKDLLPKTMVLLAVILMVFGCATTKRVKTNDEVVFGTMYGYTQVINNRQLDSICIVDVLPRNLNEWTSSNFYDYETGIKTVKKMYIKELNDRNELIYILIPRDTLYKITKRIGVEEWQSLVLNHLKWMVVSTFLVLVMGRVYQKSILIKNIFLWY